MRISDWSSDVCSSDLGFVKKISVMASATMMTLGCMTQAVAQQEAVPAADGQQQAAPNSSAPPPAQPADQAPYATIPVPTKAPPPVATTPSNNSRNIEDVIITARRISESMQDLPEIGSAHVCTPVTHAHLVCR